MRNQNALSLDEIDALLDAPGKLSKADADRIMRGIRPITPTAKTVARSADFEIHEEFGLTESELKELDALRSGVAEHLDTLV